MSSQAIRQKAIAELEKDGRVTAAALVEAARDRKHPLHGDFDWNDKSAAHKQRIEKAREIIASVRVIVTTSTQRISSVSYMRDPSMAPGVQGYISVARLQTDAEMAYATLQQEANRIAASVERARQYAAVVDLEDEIEDILRSIARLRSAASPRVASPGVQPAA